MVDPIEEFLRRAAQHRRQQVPDEELAEEEILDAEVIEEPPPPAEPVGRPILSGGGVAEHVKQHMGSAGFEERAARLGATVDASDDRMEAHLHEVFEHKLGDLGVTTSVAKESTLDDDSGKTAEPPALDIRKLFSTPDNVRNAILLNEILQRPEHRW